MMSEKLQKVAAPTIRTVPSVENVPVATMNMQKKKIIKMKTKKTKMTPFLRKTKVKRRMKPACEKKEPKGGPGKGAANEDDNTMRSEKLQKVAAATIPTVPSVESVPEATNMQTKKTTKTKKKETKTTPFSMKTKAKRRMKPACEKKSRRGSRNGVAKEVVHVGRAEVRDRLYRSLQGNTEEGRCLAALIEKRCQVSWDMWDFRNSIDKKRAQKA
jgi:hypothetical protein